jgi:hypothetical protein
MVLPDVWLKNPEEAFFNWTAPNPIGRYLFKGPRFPTTSKHGGILSKEPQKKLTKSDKRCTNTQLTKVNFARNRKSHFIARDDGNN